MPYTSQWEMFIVGYVNEKKVANLGGKISVNTRACGVGKEFGLGKNKGGMQIYFHYNERTFNFIGGHLVHGQDNRLARDDMMEEIVRALKIEREEFDADVLCDYNFIIGDLNYRFDSTYEDMMANNQINIASTLID